MEYKIVLKSLLMSLNTSYGRREIGLCSLINGRTEVCDAPPCTKPILFLDGQLCVEHPADGPDAVREHPLVKSKAH